MVITGEPQYVDPPRLQLWVRLGLTCPKKQKASLIPPLALTTQQAAQVKFYFTKMKKMDGWKRLGGGYGRLRHSNASWNQ